jgi:multiple sugar transport system substrate-binding protein
MRRVNHSSSQGVIGLKRYFTYFTVIAIVFAMVLSACSKSGNDSGGGSASGQPSASAPASESAKPAEKVQIHLSTWAGEAEAKELQAILDKLNADSQTYEIVQDSNPADYDTRIVTQLSGGSGPDLFWVSAQNAAKFASQGALLDITDRLKSSSAPAAQVSDYFPSSLSPFTVQGKIYGLPWLQQPVVMYVNKSLFEKAGVSLPTDSWRWDDFLKAAAQLTVDKNGKHPGDAGFDAKNVVQWGTTLNGWPPVQMFIWQNDGDVIAEDFSNSPIDSAKSMEAFKFYSDLVNGPLVPSQQTIRDRGFDTMFRNNQVAMFFGGAADDLDSKVPNVQAFTAPAGPNGTKATFTDILGMGINVKTKNPDAAFQALVDLTDAIHHWKIMPPRSSLADLETLKQMHPEKAQSLPAIIASMEFGRPYRFFGKYADWDNVFWTQLMDKIVNAKADPAQIVPKVKSTLDQILKSGN